ncbi:MAG TPA: hypothetical protein VFU90_09725, partial [Candidatus Tumulicola sp.]|nr:hypothetical protein [Candidatus Tumulicola sp.]
MTIKRFFGLLAATTFGAASLLSTLPASAQVVYAPSAGAPISPYTPILASLEPQGCPLYGNGQWAFINNVWIWCPPTAVAVAPPVGQAALSGYYGFGATMPPPTIAVAPPQAIAYAPVYGSSFGAPSYATPYPYGTYGSPYAYGTPVAYIPPYGYGYPAPAPAAYPYPYGGGYGYPQQYPQTAYPYPYGGGYGYPQPYPQQYPYPYGGGYPGGYGYPGGGYGYPGGGYGYPGGGYGSLTGSPLLDMLIGVVATGLISSALQPSYNQGYGYPGYGYGAPSYGYGAPSYGYQGYGYPYAQNYPVAYQNPGYGYGNGYGYGGGGNTYYYTKNVYKYYGNGGNKGGSGSGKQPRIMHPYFHPINNELTWIARDRARIAMLRGEGGHAAQIAQLKRNIWRDQNRLARLRTERNRFDQHVAGRNLVRANAPRLAAAHVVAPRMITAHVTAPRMTTAHVTAPRMTTAHVIAPRMTTAHVVAPR